MNIVKLLNKKYGISYNLFKTGLYNRFDNSVRIYLDGLINELGYKKSIDKINLILYVSKEQFKKHIKSNYCFVYFVYAKTKNNFNINRCNIDCRKCHIFLPKNIDYFSFYDDADELYKFVIMYKVKSSIFSKIVKHSIYRHFIEEPFSKEPYLSPDIFFASLDLNTVINVYDDRGMDIVHPKKIFKSVTCKI